MERAIRLKNKAVFVFIYGVLGWGGLTALLFTLLTRYADHHAETAYQIIGTFVIFMAMGVSFGLSLWKRAHVPPRKVGRRTEIVRLVLFWGLMIGLACALWVVARH